MNRCVSCIFLVFITSCVFQGSKEKAYLEKQVDELYDKDECVLAIPLLTKLIEMDEDNPENYFKRAYCYALIFEYDSSTFDYLKSIDLNYRLEDCYYNLGLNYNVIDDSLAIVYYKKALEINPKSEDVMFQISRAVLRLNKE